MKLGCAKRRFSIDLTYKYYTNNKFKQNGKVIAEYIWIDGTGINMRSKSRTLTKPVTDVSSIPSWNFDGSSTQQATTEDSEVILKPVAYYPDPLRGGDNILVLCSTYRFADKEQKEIRPANTNFRHFAEKILELAKDEEPWFGLEQEYTLFDEHNSFTRRPLGWPKNGFLAEQGPYYCSVGNNVCFGRSILDLHYQACLTANLSIAGVNIEVMPGQVEFQIGPSIGIEACDHLWVARYLLGRITEDLDITVDFHPKPIPGDWNGAGCHANFSTNSMRKEGGYKAIVDAIE